MLSSRVGKNKNSEPTENHEKENRGGKTAKTAKTTEAAKTGKGQKTKTTKKREQTEKRKIPGKAEKRHCPTGCEISSSPKRKRIDVVDQNEDTIPLEYRDYTAQTIEPPIETFETDAGEEYDKETLETSPPSQTNIFRQDLNHPFNVLETAKPEKETHWITRDAEMFRKISCCKNTICTITTNLQIDLTKFTKK